MYCKPLSFTDVPPACLFSVSQVMERLSVCVQQQVCVLRGVGEMEEIQAAKQVLKEARNSRAVSVCAYLNHFSNLSIVVECSSVCGLPLN